MTGTHASKDLLDRYAAGVPGIEPDPLRALEAVPRQFAAAPEEHR
jgi:hypothetical protein